MVACARVRVVGEASPWDGSLGAQRSPSPTCRRPRRPREQGDSVVVQPNDRYQPAPRGTAGLHSPSLVPCQRPNWGAPAGGGGLAGEGLPLKLQARRAGGERTGRKPQAGRHATCLPRAKRRAGSVECFGKTGTVSLRCPRRVCPRALPSTASGRGIKGTPSCQMPAPPAARRACPAPISAQRRQCGRLPERHYGHKMGECLSRSLRLKAHLGEI